MKKSKETKETKETIVWGTFDIEPKQKIKNPVYSTEFNNHLNSAIENLMLRIRVEKEVGFKCNIPEYIFELADNFLNNPRGSKYLKKEDLVIIITTKLINNGVNVINNQ